MAYVHTKNLPLTTFILEGLGIENVGMFYGHLEYFMQKLLHFEVIWHIPPFGIFPPFWYIAPRKIWPPWLPCTRLYLMFTSFSTRDAFWKDH
jgi:hypothetical protein